MEIKLIKQEKDSANFLVKDVNNVFINSLRRLVVNDVPSLAIEDVNFIKNGSALHDEVLALRLGLVPLSTDLKTYNLKSECKCKGKGCSHCELFFSLKSKGPCVVYAEDIKTKDKEVKAAFPKMILVKLLKDQSIELEGKIVLSNGRDHTKFSPGLMYFRAYPNIRFNKDEIKNYEEVINSCPKRVYENKDGLSVKNLEECDLCMACVEVNNKIEVKGSKEDFIVFLESWGQLSCKDILVSAVDRFDNKLDGFDSAIKNLK